MCIENVLFIRIIRSNSVSLNTSCLFKRGFQGNSLSSENTNCTKCFHENYIVSNYISVISSGVPVTTELLNKQVKVSPDMAIFITMNPGYAGRSNLPDNLKKLFRSLAMTKPDRQLIAQVMLYSQGFRTAEILAKKIVPFFKYVLFKKNVSGFERILKVLSSLNLSLASISGCVMSNCHHRVTMISASELSRVC